MADVIKDIFMADFLFNGELNPTNLTSNMILLISLIILGLVVMWTVVLCRKCRKKVEEVIPQIKSRMGAGKKTPRFRKRDKVMFYGRKMLRKVNSSLSMSKMDTSGRRIKKRQLVLKFAKRLMRLSKKDSKPLLRPKEPPPAYLEEDLVEEKELELPPEVLYMLKSVRVLGHFEKPMFFELCKHTTSLCIPQHGYLFRIGEKDNSIYVVQAGKICLSVTQLDGTELVVKEVGPGDSIQSLLSIIDVLTGYEAPYKTVSARALEATTVIRLPVSAFSEILKQYPGSLVRIVQIIMIRLQRVTFTALHNYLGLSAELINPEGSSQTFSVQSLADNRIPAAGASTARGRPPTRHPAMSEEDERAYPSSGSDSERVINVTNMYSSSEADTADSKRDNEEEFNAACERARVYSTERNLSQSSTDFHEGKKLERNLSLPVRRLGGSDSGGEGKARTKRKVSWSTTPEEVIEGRHSSDMILEAVRAKKSEDARMLKLAVEDLKRLLHIDDEKVFEGRLRLIQVSTGKVLCRQNEVDASLYFVVTGSLQVSQKVIDKEHAESLLFRAYPGEIVGTLSVLTGEASMFSIRARQSSHLVVISKSDVYDVMRDHPKVVLCIAHSIVQRLSPFVRSIDFALDWIQVEAGRAVYRQDDSSESVYILLSGRLRSIITRPNTKKDIIEEFGRGELVGVVEVLTQTPRTTTLMAVRDTELAKLPDGLLNLIKRKYPQVVSRLMHLLGQRVLTSLQRPLGEGVVEPKSAFGNLSTVAVLPVSDDVPLESFTLELTHFVEAIGSVLRLTSDTVRSSLGASALDSIYDYHLSSWLAQQDDMHSMVIYQCDYRVTPWTQRCIRHADCILIVALADQEPIVAKLESQMSHAGMRAQKELVILHGGDAVSPARTAEWLNLRDWCNSHHHIRCPKRMFLRKPPTKMKEMYERILKKPQDRHSDFARLARFLTGTSVGLILGGGGARGAAHVGIIKAMCEYGIPIDMVGGTSIGSFMGGLWAEERNLTRFTQRAREWSHDMTSLWKKVLDLTYPIAAMFSGRAFNQGIEVVFKDKQIEDLWLPYFCITTDITASTMRIHTSGSLWRYVRASMSLSGYLPPLCDPIDGHLLLDGGYVNNLPADVMKQMGANHIIAVDVGSQDDSDLSNYGDVLSGWWLLWKRWWPWASPIRVPDMTEIQSRLAYVSCVRQLEQVKKQDYVMYVRPPIDMYKTLQFGSFDEIHDVGYRHGKAIFEQMKKSGKLSSILKDKHSPTASSHHVYRTNRENRIMSLQSYTNLATLVSRIEEPLSSVVSSVSDDEYEDDDLLDDMSFGLTTQSDMSTQSAPEDGSSLRQRRDLNAKQTLSEPVNFTIGSK